MRENSNLLSLMNLAVTKANAGNSNASSPNRRGKDVSSQPQKTNTYAMLVAGQFTVRKRATSVLIRKKNSKDDSDYHKDQTGKTRNNYKQNLPLKKNPSISALRKRKGQCRSTSAKPADR